MQAAFAAFVILVGYEFWCFFRNAISGELVTTRRPPAVEAFLPISALVGLRRWVVSGTWDDVHPAGLAILLAAALASFAARKAFCSWICPGGTLSRLLERLGDVTLFRRARRRRVPRWLDLSLSGVKHALLAFFVWAIFIQMPAESVDAFVHSPFNVSADARMLLFFQDLSAFAGTVLLALVALSVVVKHFWCRYLCPYGALLGLLSLGSPQRVVRDDSTCNDCGACTRACPVEIPVHARASVWTSECTGCLSCVAACTVPDCLTVGRRGRAGWRPWAVPGTALFAFLAVWAAARMTGHWDTTVPAAALAHAYRALRWFAPTR